MARTLLSRIRRSSTEELATGKPRKKSKRRKEDSKDREWFRASDVHSGWSKDYPAKKRRKLLLKALRGNVLRAARSKQALANVTRDKETKDKAGADAKYFFELHKKLKRRHRR